MPDHRVKISIVKKKLKYDRESVDVLCGDTITWKLDVQKDPPPFAIMVKSPISPLVWSHAVSEKGKATLVGKVREDAEPGYYHYGACVWDGKSLLVDDPEIIVKRP